NPLDADVPIGHCFPWWFPYLVSFAASKLGRLGAGNHLKVLTIFGTLPVRTLSLYELERKNGKDPIRAFPF
ncbi:MAG: hypothetical protein ABQ298_05115, partial [Puniceicoccaceae bacterium]